MAAASEREKYSSEKEEIDAYKEQKKWENRVLTGEVLRAFLILSLMMIRFLVSFLCTLKGVKDYTRFSRVTWKGWFESLESLKVFECWSVEVIFKIKDSQQIDASAGIDTNLWLILVDNLPKLKQVWSTDPKGILNFKNLPSIVVSCCHKPRDVFPASVAKDVQKLECMSVQFCQ